MCTRNVALTVVLVAGGICLGAGPLAAESGYPLKFEFGEPRDTPGAWRLLRDHAERYRPAARQRQLRGGKENLRRDLRRLSRREAGRQSPEGSRRRQADRRSGHTGNNGARQDDRKLLALRDDDLRLRQACDAIQRTGLADRPAGLQRGRLHSRRSQHHQTDRCHRRDNATKGANAQSRWLRWRSKTRNRAIPLTRMSRLRWDIADDLKIALIERRTSDHFSARPLEVQARRPV